MVTRFCPRCYSANAAEAGTCRHCGAALASPAGDDYLAKLVWALHHPEPETRVRAAELIGRMGKAALPAVAALVQAYTSAGDPFLRAAVVKACGSIGGDEASELVLKGAADPSYIVRLSSLAALEKAISTAGEKRKKEMVDMIRHLAKGDPGSVVREKAAELINRLGLK